jgi:AraC-like DNA-binding protein
MVDVNYVEHPPPAPLVPWLECAWEREGDGSAPVRVLPDGCIDVVWTEGMGAQLIGPNTTAFLVTVPLGARVHGVRLRPGAAASLLDVRPEELRDVRTPVEHVFPSLAPRLDALAAPARASPRDVLIDWLQGRSRGAVAPDPIVAAAVTRLQRPGVTVRALAAELGVSERSLHRRVRVAVGYGPKRLARVLRLQRALSAARLGEELARVAFEGGYADQSHFTNECRGLAGTSPAALISA